MITGQEAYQNHKDMDMDNMRCNTLTKLTFQNLQGKFFRPIRIIDTEALSNFEPVTNEHVNILIFPEFLAILYKCTN